MLTHYENHRTERGFQNAMTQKIFILTFLTGYLSMLLTAYVYSLFPKSVCHLTYIVPFGDYIVPKLTFFTTNYDSRNSFVVDRVRLEQQVIYFTVTGQLLQMVEEYLVPYITRKLFSEAKRITHIGDDTTSSFDPKEEKVFLNNVRKEIELPEYEVYEDYAEMVVQVSPYLSDLFE